MSKISDDEFIAVEKKCSYQVSKKTVDNLTVDEMTWYPTRLANEYKKILASHIKVFFGYGSVQVINRFYLLSTLLKTGHSLVNTRKSIG